MNEESRYPRVTFALIAYNQEKYIREAIEGALAQDYPNLEIIISDDCSTDQTFQEMRLAVSRAPAGLSLKLVRQDQNRGVGAHINSVMKLVEGELVVIAAGDDVSRPDRTSQLVAKWMALKKAPGVLHSACKIVDESGHASGELTCTWLDDLVDAQRFVKNNQRIVGATAAWVPDLFSFFGDLDGNLVNEDRAIPFRALLLGRPIAYVEEPLVRYRQGVGVSTIYWKKNVRTRSQRVRVLENLRGDVLQKLADLRKAPSGHLEADLTRMLAIFDVNIWFERGFPSWPAILPAMRLAGFWAVLRSVVKFSLNSLSAAFKGR